MAFIREIRENFLPWKIFVTLETLMDRTLSQDNMALKVG